MNIQKYSLVFGLQYGDEGKGKIIDILSKDYDVVVRFSNGEQHTVFHEGSKYILNYLPTGILTSGKKNILAQGMMLDLNKLNEEIKALKALGIRIDPQNLFISSLALVYMPWDMVDGEATVYSDFLNKKAVRLIDIFSPSFKEKFLSLGEEKNKVINALGKTKIDLDKEYEDLIKNFEYIKRYITDTYTLLCEFKKQDQKILFEGTNGMMLDLNYGPYPYVGNFNYDSSSVSRGTGLNLDLFKVGVLKPYVTTVLGCALPTEINNNAADSIRDKGYEYVNGTDPKRIGWFDLPMVKYALDFGIDELALMKLDALSNVDEIQICTKYMDVYDDKELEYIPSDNEYLKGVTKVYDSYPSWREDILGKNKYADLPKACKDFIENLEDILGKKFKYISTGPLSENTIIR